MQCQAGQDEDLDFTEHLLHISHCLNKRSRGERVLPLEPLVRHDSMSEACGPSAQPPPWHGGEAEPWLASVAS